MDNVNSNYRGKQKNWVLLYHILHLPIHWLNLTWIFTYKGKVNWIPNPTLLYHHHLAHGMKSLRNRYLKKTPHPNNNQKKKALKLFAPDANFSECLLGILSVLSECAHQVRKIVTNLFRISMFSYRHLFH